MFKLVTTVRPGPSRQVRQTRSELDDLHDASVTQIIQSLRLYVSGLSGLRFRNLSFCGHALI